MEKDFVPYELAVKLKALGFDEECLGYYNSRELIYNNHTNNHMQRFRYSAPTFSQCFRWFREKHNLYHTIDKQGYWFFEIKKEEGFGDLTEVVVFYDYNSYEEAELACLDKLIEIVEAKSE